MAQGSKPRNQQSRGDTLREADTIQLFNRHGEIMESILCPSTIKKIYEDFNREEQNSVGNSCCFADIKSTIERSQIAESEKKSLTA